MLCCLWMMSKKESNLSNAVRELSTGDLTTTLALFDYGEKTVNNKAA